MVSIFMQSRMALFFPVFILTAIFCFMTRLAQAEAADESARIFRERWYQADTLQASKSFTEAEQQYREILELYPNSQRTALRIAICQQNAGRKLDSLASYDNAIAMDPNGYWAGVALFYKARACFESGLVLDAISSLNELRERFPDSSYVAQAGVLEAEWLKGPKLLMEAHLKIELDAAEQYDLAMVSSKAGEDERALETLALLSKRFPGTAAALRAEESRGHILLRGKRYDEAKEVFTGLIQTLGKEKSKSRIFETAKTRLAAIHHIEYDRETALALYLEILEGQGDPGIAAHAALQAAGVAFEILQREVIAEKEISEERWDELRSACIKVSELPHASDHQRVRADLMFVESWHWQRQNELAVQSARDFIEKYDENEFKREVATARMVAALNLHLLKRYREALEQADWIIHAYSEEDEIWPLMDHLPRTYYLRWEILKDNDAPKSQLQKAAEDLIQRFPDSPLAEGIRSRKPLWTGWED